MPDPYRFGSVEVRPAQRQVLVQGQAVVLGARAFDVLIALIEWRDRLVTKDELLDRVWPGLEVEENNLQVQISALRRTLGASSIATVPGLGYRFARVLNDVAAPAPHAGCEATSSPTTNVAHELEPLVGREAELQRLVADLAASRLVCIAGPGGIGKTRLAQAAARAALGQHAGGVWWVDLAALSSADKLVPGIAKAAQIPFNQGDLAELLNKLTCREMLLVLDNCEHLVAAVAEVVSAVLAQAASVRVLATSQEPLQLKGETVIRLEPLALPTASANLEAARASGALQLFERRAHAADRRFALSAGNVAQAIELCRGLDGLPLAIEMAAARAPLLGLTALTEQLNDRLSLLRAASRDMPARQRSLRLTLDWSHSLLCADEQMLLRRLSVFAGTFGIETAQRFATAGGFDAGAALTALEGLVERSLVQLEGVEPPRYRLLETTRVYGREKLAEAAEVEMVLRAHGRAMADLAERAGRQRAEGVSASWLARYMPDYDDLSEAFERARERGDADSAAVIVNVLRHLDQLRAMFSNSGRRVQAAIDLLPLASPRGQAGLNSFIASCGWVTPRDVSRVECARRAVELWRSLGEARRLFSALCVYATESSRVRGFDDAQAALDEAGRLEDPDWPHFFRMFRLMHAGWVAYFSSDLARCRNVLREALDFALRHGEREMALTARSWLAGAAFGLGHVEEAQALARTAVEESRALGQPESMSVGLSTWCATLLIQRNVELARGAVAELFDLEREGPSSAVSESTLVMIAALAAMTGDGANAMRLLGYLEVDSADGPKVTDDGDRRLLDIAEETARQVVSRDEAPPLRGAGRRMSEREATAVGAAVIAGLRAADV